MALHSVLICFLSFVIWTIFCDCISNFFSSLSATLLRPKIQKSDQSALMATAGCQNPSQNQLSTCYWLSEPTQRIFRDPAGRGAISWGKDTGWHPEEHPEQSEGKQPLRKDTPQSCHNLHPSCRNPGGAPYPQISEVWSVFVW